jgi:hypothetical protein
MKRFLYITEISLVPLTVLAAGTVGVMASSGENSPALAHKSKQPVSDKDYDSLLFPGKK